MTKRSPILPRSVRLFAAVTLLLVAIPAFAEFVLPPAPGRHIIDKVGILDAGTLAYLEERLTRFERDTGHQMVVAVFKSIEGDDLNDVANRLFKKWGLGDKTQNDGILLVLFYDERISRIEVGYGLEGILTDARSARILRQELQPEFQTGRFGTGMRKAVAAVEALVTDPSSAPPEAAREDEEASPANKLLLALVVAFVIITVLMALGSRRTGTELTGRGRRGYRDPWGGWSPLRNW